MLDTHIRIPRPVVTGFFGIPGGKTGTKVHIVDAGTGVPVCQSRISTEAQFQWCAPGAHMPYVECLLCQRWETKKRMGNWSNPK